jgi:hypothetical protein
VVLCLRHAEVEFVGHAQRPGHVFPKDLRDGRAGDATNDLPNHVAEGVGTVDHVLIIDRGRLIASGRLDELTEDGRTLEDVFLGLTGVLS